MMNTAERRRTWFRLSLVANIALIVFVLSVYAGKHKDASFADQTHVVESSSIHDHDQFRALLKSDKGLASELCPKPIKPAPEKVIVEVEKIVKEYVNVKQDKCGMCEGPVGKKLCEQYGEEEVRRSVTYPGSNKRLRRVLDKMRNGKDFKMAVVGGSVSSGHGLKEDDHKYGPGNMHAILYKHLQDTFKPTKSEFINGGQPAQGAEYFCMCAHLHIPEDADLIVVEVGINSPPAKPSVEAFELLIRSLLQRENEPAVLIYNTFALMFDNIAMAGDLNYGVAQFYDVPVVDSRVALLQSVWDDHTILPKWFTNDKAFPSGIDLRHFGPTLHAFSGDVMMAYIESQLCEMDALEKADAKTKYTIGEVPPQRVFGKFTPGKVEPILKPFCRTTNSDTFPLLPKDNHGWREWSSSPEKKYWIADEPGSKISFPFTTTQGNVILQYLRSREFGLGNIRCWIDDTEDSTTKYIEGYWNEPYNIGRTTTWDRVAPGEHTLHCVLRDQTADPGGKKEFRIISLMSI